MTLTRQLQAMEIDEIPDRFKIANKKPRWLFRLGLVVLLVGAGVGVGMVAFSGDDGAREVTLDVRSNPEGARVTIDGQALSQTTPVRFPEAEMGRTYKLTFTLEGYKTREKSVVIDAQEDEVLVFLEQVPSTVTLIVESVPKGATIVIGGKEYGTAPRRVTGLDPKKATTLELRMSGYQTHRESLDWSGDRESTLQIRLRKR